MAFGIGLGSFMTGLVQGAQAGAGIKRARSEQELLDMKVEDAKQERTDRQQLRDINSQMGQFNPDAGVGNVMDTYMRDIAPRYQSALIQQGRPQEAATFGRWIQDQNVQRGMQNATRTMAYFSSGQYDQALDSMVETFNTPGYFDNGFSAVGHNITRDEQGNVSGVEFQLRDDSTGQVQTHRFNNMEDVYGLFQQFAAPETVFQQGMADMRSARQAQQQAAQTAGTRDWETQKMGMQHDYRLREQANQSQLRMAEQTQQAQNPQANTRVRDASAIAQYLRDNGYSDEQIRNWLPSMLNISNQQRPMATRIDDFIRTNSEMDRAFRNLPMEEKIQAAQEYIQQIDAASGNSPQAGGQQQQQQQPQQSGVPLYDTQTGTVIYR